jgi:hypothetical protein
MPWIVNWFDLEIVCALVDHPAQLTHYMQSRQKAPSSLVFGDELDLFMIYLSHGMPTAVPAESALVTNWTQDLDSWWMFKNAPRPTMHLSDDERDRLTQLLRNRRPGWLPEAEELIKRSLAAHPLEMQTFPSGAAQRAHDVISAILRDE